MSKLFFQELKRISKLYVFNILISLDQLANTLLYGSPDETISSRLGRNYKKSWMKNIVDWMFSWQHRKNGHCEDAVEPVDRENEAIIK